MARRTMTGQLNMFDFFSSLDESEVGEVEMISFGPNFDEEPEPEIVEEPQPEVMEEPAVEEPQPEEMEEPTVEEPQSEVIEEPQIIKSGDEQVAMSRTYIIDGTTLEIAYINYNKVRITRGNEMPEIKVFESSKEAVDYYVEKMQEYEED